MDRQTRASLARILAPPPLLPNALGDASWEPMGSHHPGARYETHFLAA